MIKSNAKILAGETGGRMIAERNAIVDKDKKRRMGSTTHPFLIKLTNLTKPKLMKINVTQR